MNEQKKKPIGILLTVILISALLTVCLELGLGYLRPDTPGSIPKHLIHFAIMFVLLGGATLLCLFCPPFKKLWAWLDKNIMTQETRPIAIDIIYAVIAGLMLLHHFYVILYYPTLPTGATRFAPVWIVFAALTVILGKSWQNISFRLAAIFLIYTFERLYIKDLIITSNNIVYFSSAIYALFICLCTFHILRPGFRKAFLQTLCVLWTLATLALSFAGLYTAWTGIPSHNLVGTITEVLRGRLRIFSTATITASNIGCGLIMTLIGFAIAKHKLIKLFYLFACFIAMITNSLTDSRSSFLALSFIISGMLCLSFWNIYRNREFKNYSGKKTALIITALVLCFGTVFYGAVEGQRYLAIAFVEARDNGNFVIPTAEAEDSTTESITPPPPDFSQRDVWISDDADLNLALNGRYVIWQRAFRFIQENPSIIFNGLSVDGSVPSAIIRLDHSHNILLQTLLEGGIPSLLLYFAMIIYGTFHSFRLLNRRGIPFWQRVLPLPIFAFLLWDMADCLTHFSFGHPPMTLFWFFLGATITVSKSLGKSPKSPIIPEETTAIETGE